MCTVQEHATSEDKSFSLIQPGSSVATALSEGESKKKHVVLFEINRERYRTVNFPLESVRPFIHDNVS
jgi:double-strand break repair protein MRE11